MSNEPKYIEMRPKSFDSHKIISYIDILDKRLVRAEIDYVVNEKMTNESLSVSLAKVKATNDERYKKVKKQLSDKKILYLYAKVEAKNGHSYCDHLKQESINYLATEKLTRN